jgi:uncharacterized RDD family membrane protein YckC
MQATEPPRPPPLPADVSDRDAATSGMANPYAAPAARAVDFPGLTVALGGRAERLLAVFLDGLLYAVGFVPMFAVAVIHGDRAEPPPAFYLAALLGFAIAIALFVYNLLLLQREGQTIGKRWMRLRIVRKDGSRADLGQLFALRMLVPGLIGAVPCLGAVFALADALAIFGEQRRCIHDLIADTIVVVA